jgi:hypothetical protein
LWAVAGPVRRQSSIQHGAMRIFILFSAICIHLPEQSTQQQVLNMGKKFSAPINKTQTGGILAALTQSQLLEASAQCSYNSFFLFRLFDDEFFFQVPK